MLMKNMLPAILAPLLLLLAATSCNDDEKSSAALKVSPEALDFSADASSRELVVTSGREWKIRSDASWCVVRGAETFNKPATGKTLRIEVAENRTGKIRETVIVVTQTGGDKKSIAVTQQAGGAPAPRIRSFRFGREANPGKLEQDIVLEIDGERIHASSSFVIEDKTLVPEFEFDGEKVLADGREVVSGSTALDFSGPVALTVTGSDGQTKEYTVRLTGLYGLPVVFLDTKGVEITSKEEYVAATIRIIDNNGLRPSSILESDVDVKGRGNSTWIMPKKPYRLKFEEKQSLLGEPKDKSWVLLANYMDNACGMRNATAYAIGRLSCLDFTPTVHYVDLFLNDKYNGTYQIAEHMKISEDRVNVTDNGYLIEADQLDRLGPDDVYFETEKTGLLFNIKDPDVVKGSPEYDWIKEYLDRAEAALYGADFTDPEKGYAAYLNVDTYVDWYVISEITKTNDASLYTSCYMNIERGKKLNMGPIWDFDICMGNTKWNGDGDRGPEGYWNRESPWFKRMLEDPAFVAKVKERIAYFRANLQPLLTGMDQTAEYAAASVVADNRLWHNLAPEGTSDTEVRKIFLQEVAAMKEWLTRRLDWLNAASFTD